MLIGIDASPAAKSQKTGVEWYCHHVILQLAMLDNENTIRLYSKAPLPEELVTVSERVEQVVLPDQQFWTHRALAQELRRRSVDVFYSPGHVIPWWHPRRSIFTLHDAGFRHNRDSYSTYQFVHATINTWSSLRWASCIVVPSEFVAKDVSRLHRTAHERIVVVPNGFQEGEFVGIEVDEVNAAKRRHGITKPYFIFVGRLDQRKNLIRLMEAFSRLSAEAPGEFQLVLVGAPGIGYDKIDAYIANRPPGEIMQTGYVDPKTKANLLAGALAMVFPSKYEGFGIPILEGFAAGIPVLTSDSSSCAEVGGEAALLVNPNDVDAIANGMRRLLYDNEFRRTLIGRGRARVDRYSWAQTATMIHRLLVSAN